MKKELITCYFARPGNDLIKPTTIFHAAIVLGHQRGTVVSALSVCGLRVGDKTMYYGQKQAKPIETAQFKVNCPGCIEAIAQLQTMVDQTLVK